MKPSGQGAAATSLSPHTVLLTFNSCHKLLVSKSLCDSIFSREPDYARPLHAVTVVN